MAITTAPTRYYFIDYLRGFMVALVVLDHSMHAYSPHFKSYWYIPDFGGSLFFDLWHMHNDAIMMPMLFFLAGLFVLPSLRRRGPLDFSGEKFLRLVVPLIFGTLIIVPPQTYGKYITLKDGTLDYLSYLQQKFFFQDFSLSAFWFLSALLVLTFGLVFIDRFLPFIIRGLKAFANNCANHPKSSFAFIFLMVATLMTLSDFIWGAHWWVHFNDLLVVRGSRFLTKIFFFFLGAGFAEANFFDKKSVQGHLKKNWNLWAIATILIGATYAAYSLINFTQAQGPYNFEILRALRQDASLADIVPILGPYGLPVALRTCLLSGFMISLGVTYCGVFYRYFNSTSSRWRSLAACSFGIYIFHEPITVWTHIYFYEQPLHVGFKFIVTAALSLGLSWILTHYLRSLPGLKRIL